MPSFWFYTDPEDKQHQMGLFIQKNKPWLNMDFRFVEEAGLNYIVNMLTARGHRVRLTANNDPFDMWVDEARVEVKVARYHQAGGHGGGRYQAAIRNHQADLLILDCINGSHHLHFIPIAAIGSLKSIAVWSHNPAKSAGRWASYLDAVENLDMAIYRAWANHKNQVTLC